MLAIGPSPRKRDLRIDSLRGLLLVFMAIDHIASDLQIATNHIFGYVSSAEGFVFISGLTAGLVYTRRRWNDGHEAAQAASWRRAGVLYAFHMALYLFVLIVAPTERLLHHAPMIPPPSSDVASWHTLTAGALLLNQPPLLDILPMYCVFLFGLPALLAAFDRGRRMEILTASFLLWVVSNLFLSPVPWTFDVVRTSSFNLTAWQLLFVAGAACGHAWIAGDRIVPKASTPLIALTTAFCAACYIVRHAFIPPPMPRAALDWLTDKNTLAPLRLLNTAALFYLFHVIAVRFPRVMHWPPLAFLGRNALPVFSVHVAVAYILAGYPSYFADTARGRWMGTAIMIIALVAAASIRVRRPARALAPQPA